MIGGRGDIAPSVALEVAGDQQAEAVFPSGLLDGLLRQAVEEGLVFCGDARAADWHREALGGRDDRRCKRLCRNGLRGKRSGLRGRLLLGHGQGGWYGGAGHLLLERDNPLRLGGRLYVACQRRGRNGADRRPVQEDAQHHGCGRSDAGERPGPEGDHALTGVQGGGNAFPDLG